MRKNYGKFQNKAVLLSIQPKWCELIASGKKTIEVRKDKPTEETPFKCCIYETKGICEVPQFIDEDGHASYRGRGQVIGEFVCDEIDEIAGFRLLNEPGFGYRPLYEADEIPPEELEDKACLDEYELENYLGFKGDGYVVGYAWHISELKIYDEPKKLNKFLKPCKWRVYHGWTDYECEARSHKVGCQYAIEDRNPDGSVNDYICGYKDYVTRPPQSWMYVETPLMHYDEV